MRNYFENDYTSFRFHDDVLHIIYHQGTSIDLNAAIQIVKDRLTLQEGQSLPILCDVRGIKEINKAARSYLALEGSTLIKALAVIVDPPVSKIMWDFYIRTSNPPIPNKSCESMDEALTFLKKFI
ncbi:DUF7793 family protein [Cellulophaga baltica]|uniref:DUF7793 domain-containing protein n=1 Tax=Cellulophaga baltica TaxID=76594 RepID=A0A1G7EC66_9FLAO|nr:hypothetical protein [Cellulophaga baltica]SDE61242.1 hypothetical protein SAMN04487992_102232 [Cellulophaga baltica]